VIDLGPEGGAGGGRVVACGTPEEVARVKKSHTGQALKPLLGAHAANGNGHKPARQGKTPAPRAGKKSA
jgi:excinuclease ABC subunit A